MKNKVIAVNYGVTWKIFLGTRDSNSAPVLGYASARTSELLPSIVFKTQYESTISNPTAIYVLLPSIDGLIFRTLEEKA